MAGICQLNEKLPAHILPCTNRAYVVGATPAGTTVSADSVAANTVGERIDVRHDSSINSTALVAIAADSIIARARLDSMKATITIPPHCGLELWDVITTYDTVAKQDTNYRVIGYTFEYDTRQGIYRHTLDLCAP